MTKIMAISAMIFGTIIGASIFSLLFRGLGGVDRRAALAVRLSGRRTVTRF